jgi:PAS domain S-box-containing protein
MSPTPAQIATSLLKRNQTPGFTEICAVMNLDDAPCALIDQELGVLLFINSKLIRLSGFTSSEIWEKPFEMIFGGLDLKSVVSGGMGEITLTKRDQSSLLIVARYNYLDKNSRWLRIRFDDPTQQKAEEKRMDDTAVVEMLEFARLADCESLQIALQRCAEIIQQVSKAETVCIYMADASAPQFDKAASVGEAIAFPEVLPTLDLMRLSEPFLWNPGMRVLTDLHRFGRANQFKYIGSVPLGEESAIIGLIICSGQNELPAELTLELLSILAGQVLAVEAHYLMVDSLQKENRSYARMIHLLTASFNNMSEGVVLLTPDLKIQHINPAAESILGYTTEEVQGQDYENILIGTDRISPALEEAGKGVTTHDIGKVTLNRRDGQAFPALAHILPVQMKETLIGIEVIINDISENEHNKTLNQHLEHRAVLGDYTAAFAHDLRNPINNIYTGIQLLEASLPAEDPNQKTIERIKEDCTRLNHQMESFLAYSRPTDLHLEPIDVGAYLKRTLDRWHPRFMRANIKPILQVEENLDKIKGDPKALDRVFTNLLSNAVDACTGIGDTLAVKASMNTSVAEMPMVQITVSDNGPGIPDDIRDRIFEPFVSNSQKGTGLGLAITKQIVTAHRGSINVSSFPGGTTFTVNIPACNGECE